MPHRRSGRACSWIGRQRACGTRWCVRLFQAGLVAGCWENESSESAGAAGGAAAWRGTDVLKGGVLTRGSASIMLISALRG